MITPQIARGLAIARATESMLRTLGGTEVAVRFASPTKPTTAEFGVAASTVADMPLSPVLVCTGSSAASRIHSDAGARPLSRSDKVGSGAVTDLALDFLFCAASVENAATRDGYSSPIDWFAQALGIFFNETLRPITSVSAETFAGQPYLYRVTTAT